MTHRSVRPALRLSVLPFALFCIVAGGSAAAAQSPSSERIVRDLPSILDESGVPGASVALIRDGRVAWSRGFGVKSTESGEVVQPTTLFEAASLSKPVFAYVVLRLVDQGLVDLDRPLAEILPYERLEHDPRYLRLTPGMVLSHQTGLPNWGGDPLEFRAEPGTFGYSGEGFVYLQRAVEQLTGEGLETLARREVFEPLGMTSTSYVWRTAFEGLAASGHDRLGRPVPLERFDDPNAAFSLVTTAEDYARFLAAVMRGEGLDPGTGEAILTPRVEATGWSLPEAEVGKVAWGLGVGIQRGSAEDALWHWGQRPRFTAYAIGYPESGRGLVFFLNAGHGLAIAETLLARFAPADEHWALTFLGYEPYDTPRQTASRRLLRSFAGEDPEAAARVFRDLSAERTAIIDQDLVGDLGGQLLDAGHHRGAVALYAAYTERFPESASGHGWLGEARMQLGEYDAAIEAYGRALELEPASREYARELHWVEALASSVRSAVELSEGVLERYAGDYGPRHVWLEDGELNYRRDGGSAYRLRALSPDTFTLVGLPIFRVRFVDEDDDGVPDELEGHYFDGRVDATERDPGAS